jgi:flagellar basal-body rod modification protein FlgD
LPAINSINYSQTGQTSGTQTKTEMGREQFLKILVAQLQNQDPTKPMEDKEMISQMAQLSVLEQLSNLNQSLSAYLFSNQNQNLSQYSNMLDKKVTWINPATNELESGIVSGIKYQNQLVYFQIGEQEITSNQIQSVEVNK